MSFNLNLIGVLTVTGICFIVKQISSSEIFTEAKRSKKLIGIYQPTLSDRRVNDGGTTFIANVLGQPKEGEV